MKRSIFKSKIILAVVASIFLALILACQPAGGDLLPVAGGDVKITTSQIENDTAEASVDGAVVKFSGNWTGNGYVELKIDVTNDSGKNIKINFGDFTLENGRQKRASAGIVHDKVKNSPVENKIATIAGGERGIFAVEFKSPFGSALSEDAAENMLNFSLPVEIDGAPKIVRDIKTVFKAVDKR